MFKKTTITPASISLQNNDGLNLSSPGEEGSYMERQN